MVYPPTREGRTMTNHFHIDVRKDGQFKDPTPLFRPK